MPDFEKVEALTGFQVAGLLATFEGLETATDFECVPATVLTGDM